MRCTITPILRAKATFARFEPAAWRQRLSFENRVYPRQQNIGSFIECRAHHLIPGSRDFADESFAPD